MMHLRQETALVEVLRRWRNVHRRITIEEVYWLHANLDDLYRHDLNSLA